MILKLLKLKKKYDIKYTKRENSYNKNESIQVIECLPHKVFGDISLSKD